MSHPEILQEALDNLAKRRALDREKSFSENLRATLNLMQEDHGSFIGDKQSDTQIYIFSDYNCKYCKILARSILDFSEKNPSIKFVFKDIAILGKDSQTLAKSSALAARDGKFKQFYRAAFASENSLPTGNQQEEIVAEYKFKLNSSADSERFADATLTEDQRLAQRLSISKTPTIIFSGRKWPAFNDELKAAIEKSSKSHP